MKSRLFHPLSWCLGCLLSMPLMAQVHVDRPIHLQGPEAGDRQVLGLPATIAPTAALSAALEQSGAHRHVQVDGAAVWSVSVPGLSDAPVAGTQLIITLGAPAANTDALLVNDHGPYPITLGDDGPLPALPTGAVLSLVFDGDRFHVMNGTVRQPRSCPENTVAVDDMFCIAPNEHPQGATGLFPAIMACHEAGMRLCSWGEWLMACQQREALGLNAMTGNWEWTDDMANEDLGARMVGQFNCTSASAGHVLNQNRPFRCCYSR
jgi:hypothetical protein